MNYQFKMTPWVSTVVDKNTPLPRNIMKIQNTEDKKWILWASKDKHTYKQMKNPTAPVQKSEWLWT